MPICACLIVMDSAVVTGALIGEATAILDGFGDVAARDVRGGGEIGHSARDAQNAVIGPCREGKLAHGAFEQLCALSLIHIYREYA